MYSCGQEGYLCGEPQCNVCGEEKPSDCLTHFWAKRKISKINQVLKYEVYCMDCGITGDSLEDDL